jgi:dUTP pyrophosphatase
MYIRFTDVRNVKCIERGHPTDAGLDFFMPEIDDDFVKDFEALEANNKGAVIEEARDAIAIHPGANACIPSGIKVEIPYGHMGLFLNKSGVASKKDLIIGAQVIDTFYSGEVHIDLHNVGTDTVGIKPGEKLAQMVIVPAVAAQPILCPDEDELYIDMKSEKYREEGGFGSTDKKKDKKASKK